jgi:predicted RNA-binding Zn ribbon-like protein
MALPSWVPEIETKPAPMPLLLVQSFVNTWEGDTDLDLLADESSAAAWLGDAGLLQGTLDGESLVELRRAREAIRSLLVQHAGGPAPTPDELGTLVAAAGRCRLEPVVGPDGGIELHPVDGVSGSPLTALLLIVRDAQRDGSWARLKACRNPDCRWAYFDRSHAGRGAWCDMAVCGNRIKNRNLRTRRSNERSGRTG